MYKAAGQASSRNAAQALGNSEDVLERSKNVPTNRANVLEKNRGIPTRHTSTPLTTRLQAMALLHFFVSSCLLVAKKRNSSTHPASRNSSAAPIVFVEEKK
jgi:hypothetical protein